MFNPGEFFEEVMEFYDPETGEDDRLFVKAIEGINFDVWNPSNKILFHRKSPLGKNKIGEVVSDFCKMFDLDHRTNHSVRGDCIKTLKSLGYSNEQICKLTGIGLNVDILCSFSKFLPFRAQRPQKPDLL